MYGWSQSVGDICTEAVFSMDNYVECLMEEAPAIDLEQNQWGRIRITEDNGDGHIKYYRWIEYEPSAFWGVDGVVIDYNRSLIVWDDRLILFLSLYNEAQYVRSAQ